MEDYAVLKTEILTKSSTEIANAPLFEILSTVFDGARDTSKTTSGAAKDKFYA